MAGARLERIKLDRSNEIFLGRCRNSHMRLGGARIHSLLRGWSSWMRFCCHIVKSMGWIADVYCAMFSTLIQTDAGHEVTSAKMKEREGEYYDRCRNGGW